MKRLFLLRHAKSSWGDPSLADFDRPLNERGLRAAPLVGRLMRERKVRPDLVLCSPAERARQTAALVTGAAGLKAPLRYDERIYDATKAQLLAVIRDAGDDVRELLLVGHNPGLEELLELLTGEARRMPTAALASVRLDADDWAALAPRAARLEWHVRPKELGAGAEPS